MSVTHSPVHLKPGEVVRHPEHGYGVTRRLSANGEVGITYADPDHAGIAKGDRDFTDWERIETVKPGHVQVRVDDLDLSPWEDESENEWHRPATRAAIRAAKALAAQPSPGVELPVKLPHPEPTERGAKAMFTSKDGTALRLLRVGEHSLRPWHDQRGIYFSWDELTSMDGEVGSLTLGWDDEKSAQPDEPQEFGARVTVGDERWCRQHDGYWASEYGSILDWDDLTSRGTITLGWGEDE